MNEVLTLPYHIGEREPAVMSRLASIFIFLVLFLVALLLLYESTLSNNATRLLHRGPNGRISRVEAPPKSNSQIASLSHGSRPSSLSSELSLSDQYSGVDNSSSPLGEVQADPIGDIGPVQVIVLARMRTGSTLCGEILNQNPDLFFLFEPLHALKLLFSSQDEETTDEEKFIESTGLLKKLYRCKFPRLYLHDLARWGIGKSKSADVLSICQRTEGCRRAVPRQLEQECEKSGSVAMKTIRADIRMLRPLIKSYKINLKVIHLMRDPRGTASSRRSYYSGRRRPRGFFLHRAPKERTLQELGLLSNSTETWKNTIPELCAWMKKTLGDALARPPWLKDRYRLVRYEDLAADPLRLSREIYEFIGLEMPAVVETWIRDNTENNDRSSSRKFSTHKNSSEASASWRRKLSLEEVTAVQEICGSVMDTLGYKRVYSSEELRDEARSLVDPINLGRDIMLT